MSTGTALPEAPLTEYSLKLLRESKLQPPSMIERRLLATIDARDRLLRLADAVIDCGIGICCDHAGNSCVDWCGDCQRSEASIAEHARLSSAYRTARKERVTPEAK